MTATRTALAWEYSPAPEATDHIRLRPTATSCSSAARWREAEAYEPTINPATEEPLTEIAQASAADVDAAVAAAREALPRWQRLPALERGKYVFRIARLIQERARELAIVESLDGGKPIRESRDVDIPLAAAHFFYYAGWADKLRYGLAGRDAEPMGVVGQIVPWNFPLLMAAWKLAPALACGNTAVLKPAETTPLTALLLAEICQEAELPDGVVNIIPGDGSTGAALVRHPGSTRSPSPARPRSARTSRPRSPAATSASRSSSAASRPTSCSTTRRSTRRSRASSTASSSTRATSAAPARGCCCRRAWPRRSSRSCGGGWGCCASATRSTRTPTSAPSTRPSSSQRIEALVDAGEREGATRRTVACTLPERGYWFPPTLFTDVAPVNRIAVDEIFGPVVSVLTFRTQAEAIEKANATAYGLAAGVWTDKGSRALAVARGLKAGAIWQNTYNQFDPTSPFGGYKESGFGREGGAVGLRPYVRIA